MRLKLCKEIMRKIPVLSHEREHCISQDFEKWALEESECFGGYMVEQRENYQEVEDMSLPG